MKEQVVNIETLVQDDHNFNKGTEAGRELMERSFKQLGAGRSIVIDKDGRIIAGNKSQQAAMAAGIKKVRIIETQGDELVAVKRTDLSLDSKEGRELALADNLTTQINLQWDEAELQSVAAQEGIDLDEWGLDLKEPLEDVEVTEDDFDEEKDEVKTICKEGDIWLLGRHRLMCGDSTKPEDVARLMDGEKADLWLTDPPYNVGYGMEGSAQMSQKNHRTDGLVVKNDRQGDAEFRLFLIDAFESAFANMKPGAAFYIWHSGTETFNFVYALRENNQQFRSVLIWNKNRLVMGRQDYQWKHEPCLYGWKDGAAHYFVDVRNETTVIPDAEEIDIDKMKKEEMRQLLHKIYEAQMTLPTTIIDEAKPSKSEDHPTMKPVRLFARLVRNSSRKGEIVLDTFGGSGTTIVACEQLGRKARLMELDPHYCDVIIARWEKLTGQKATKL